ncbi:MAG TPA: hypothetical protein VLG48_13935 [Candidatus Methylomirabilis sp.]|nr:hypothetical protein [Candidatus Methylomirabilis sp.]
MNGQDQDGDSDSCRVRHSSEVQAVLDHAVAEVVKPKEVAYMWPRPGQSDLIQKSAFVMKVSDQICGVGWYR